MKPDPKVVRIQETDHEPEPVVEVVPWTPDDERLAGILTQHPGGQASTWCFPPKKKARA